LIAIWVTIFVLNECWYLNSSNIEVRYHFGQSSTVLIQFYFLLFIWISIFIQRKQNNIFCLVFKL